MFDNTTAILAEAHRDALARAGWEDTSPPDPDAAVRAEIHRLEQIAPSVGTAAALLNAAGVHPLPVDRETLEPTAEPLTSLAAVADHWRANYADGVAVRAGLQPTGATVFAVRGTLSALRGWLAEVGTEMEEKLNDYGHVIHSGRSYKPVTPFTTVRWNPPPPPRARSLVSFGAAVMRDPHQGDRAAEEKALEAVAWLAWTTAAVWAVAPGVNPDAPEGQGQRRLEVRSRKLGKSLDIVGAGNVIPWHVRRGNGWTCTAGNLPIASDQGLSPWLADVVGAKWRAVR